jgi:aryl-alcohol dehydrogenase-like predicted oxidoreductase
VSLAWLRDRPTVAAPIASARTVAQLSELLPMAALTLTANETRRLEEL